MALDISLSQGTLAQEKVRPRLDFASRWRRHARSLFVTDLALVSVAALFALGVDFRQGAWLPENYRSPSLMAVAALLVVAWMVALSVSRTRDRRVAGAGPQEYSRVAHATWWTFAVIAIVSYTFGLNIARSLVGIALPIGLMLLLAGRKAWRTRLHALRARGDALATVLVAGHADNVRDLVRTLRTRPEIGYRVVGACVPAGERSVSTESLGVPVFGRFDHVPSLASEMGVDVVAVTGSDATTADSVRRLGWALSPCKIDLVLASTLTDVAGPRIIVTPVHGARLVHVDAPSLSGPRHLAKRVLDVVAASTALVLFSPLFFAIAVGVRVTSPGPVFFRQQRIGRDGQPFTMLKFRSMVVGAHQQVARLADVDEGNGLLFKIRNDPRVTPVGRCLRRTSLDELPQLLNVITGEMSLVGPRPPLPEEVARYDEVISRRLLVKPGITGLWQVNGRSDLSLEESIRLDLSYVENWTVMGDLMIMARTFRAVVRGAGAY